jgi:quinol monooxygenase YgiN
VTATAGSDQTVTLVNTFRVDPERQDALLQLLADATEQVIARLPGFVSATFHRSLDGTRVLNYARWESREAFEAIFRNPEALEHMRAIRELATGDPALYAVVSVHRQPRPEDERGR